MKKKFSQLIASAVAYFIIAAIILGVIAVIALLSGSVMRIFGFEYESVWHIILFFIITMIVGFPLELLAEGLPRALVSLGRAGKNDGFVWRYTRMTEKERMLSGKLYCPFKVGDNTWEKSREALEKFNSMPWQQEKERMQVLRDIFGHLEDDAVIVPPFYCDKGSQIYIGRHFYANTGLLILDEAEVRIGDHVFIAPRVCIYTAGHPIDAGVRRKDLEYAKGVTIGDDVWIGGNVVINPGVTIGSNVVIGSGSVVTRDIPDGVIAAGNPCRVIRKITEEDRENWERQEQEYLEDPDILR